MIFTVFQVSSCIFFFFIKIWWYWIWIIGVYINTLLNWELLFLNAYDINNNLCILTETIMQYMIPQIDCNYAYWYVTFYCMCLTSFIRKSILSGDFFLNVFQSIFIWHCFILKRFIKTFKWYVCHTLCVFSLATFYLKWYQQINLHILIMLKIKIVFHEVIKCNA